MNSGRWPRNIAFQHFFHWQSYVTKPALMSSPCVVSFDFLNKVSNFCLAKALTLLGFTLLHISISSSVVTCSQGGALLKVQKINQSNHVTMPCFCFCPEDHFPSVLEGAVNFSRWLERTTGVQ